MPRWGKPQPVSEHIKARIALEDRGYSSECWIWQGGINNCGYPTGRPAGYRHGGMHRAAYEAWVGPIPDKHVIDHLCCVRCCVNPEHLEAITHGENIRRSWERTRRQENERTAARRNPSRGWGGGHDGRRPSHTDDVRTHRGAAK